VENVKAGNLVWKKGPTSGITIGTINKIRTDIRMRNSQGKELLFIGWDIVPKPSDTAFVQARDSGAWAMDMDGNWCGMIFAELSNGRAAMQDVGRLGEDIQRMTKCTVDLP
jgi:hypothetical protein